MGGPSVDDYFDDGLLSDVNVDDAENNVQRRSITTSDFLFE